MGHDEIPSFTFETGDAFTVKEFVEAVGLGADILYEQWPVYVVAHALQRQWRVKRVEASAGGLWIVVKDV